MKDFVKRILRAMDNHASAIAARVIRLSPVVFVLCMLAAGTFVVWEGFRNADPGAATTLTISLLTGLAAPPLDLQPVQRSLAWSVVLAGWLILPTTVALLLGAAEREMERESDWAYELTKLGQEHGLSPETAREFAKKAEDIAEELTNGKR